MKKISIDRKFTVDIEDKYFDENYSQSKNEAAIIRIRAEEETVLVSDLADVIISCTFYGCSLWEEPINREKFPMLDIYLTISFSAANPFITSSVLSLEPSLTNIT